MDLTSFSSLPLSTGSHIVLGRSMETGELIHVSRADRGHRCGCSCTVCGEALLAKQGDERLWHFSHKSDSRCASSGRSQKLPLGANETALHMNGKYAIQNMDGLRIPGYFKRQALDPEIMGVDGFDFRFKEMFLGFRSSRSEVHFASLVPDVLVETRDGRQLIVEIRVTHACDMAKRAALADLGIPAVEIDLSPIHKGEVSMVNFGDLVHFIQYEAHRTWLVSLPEFVEQVERPRQEILAKQQLLAEATKFSRRCRRGLLQMRGERVRLTGLCGRGASGGSSE